MHRGRKLTRLLGVWIVAYVLIAQAALGALGMVGQAHASSGDPFGVHCLNGAAAAADQDPGDGQLHHGSCCTAACLSHAAAPPPEPAAFAFVYAPPPPAPRLSLASERPRRSIAERTPARPRDPPSAA